MDIENSMVINASDEYERGEAWRTSRKHRRLAFELKNGIPEPVDGMNGFIIPKTEAQLRFEVRQAWREEGRLDGYSSYPLGSFERGICLSEAQKIQFSEELGRDPY